MDSAKEAATSMADKASDAAKAAGDKAGEMAEAAGDKAGEMAKSAEDMVKDAADDAQAIARRRHAVAIRKRQLLQQRVKLLTLSFRAATVEAGLAPARINAAVFRPAERGFASQSVGGVPVAADPRVSTESLDLAGV